MTTLTQRRARRDMEAAIDTLQNEMRAKWSEDSVPSQWNGLDSFDGITPHKTRVTIRLDADMVKWFRAMGPNYSLRINDVLRIYWKALISGHISGYIGDDPAARAMTEMRYLAERRVRAQAEGAEPS